MEGSTRKMAKAVLLIPYLGDFPPWFDLFLLSCSRNPDYRFIIYTDKPPEHCPRYENVEFRELRLDELHGRLTELVDFEIPPLTSAYKLCDYRPAFGELFSDDLRGEAFWGHADIDVVWGRLDRFLTSESFENDIISGHATRLCGPFTLYRNTPTINALYKRASGLSDIFRDVSNYRGFDELILFDLAKTAEANGEMRLALGIGSHGHSESRATYSYLDGRILRDRDLKEMARQAVRKAVGLQDDRERMFFHFRTWKSGMIFDFDPAKVRGWQLRADRLLPIMR